MSLTIRQAGELKTLSAMTVRQGGELKTLSAGYIRQAGELKQWFGGGGGGGGLTAAISVSGGSYVDGYCQAPFGNCAATSEEYAVATPTGGTGPYTYLWEKVSDARPSQPLSFVTGTAQQTKIIRSAAVGPGAPYYAEIRCRVTDSLGAVAYTATMQVWTAHETEYEGEEE